MFTGGDLDLRQIGHRPVGHRSNVPRIADTLYQHAQRLAAADHPDHAARLRDAEHALEQYDQAAAAYHLARRELEQLSHQPVYDTGAAELIPDLTGQVEAAQHRVSRAGEHADRLTTDPAITSHADPAALLEVAEAAWSADQVAAYQQHAFGPSRSTSHEPYPTRQIDHGPSIGR